MREEKRIWPELLWYSGGLVPLAVVTIIWTAMENQVVPQRILLIAIGAALGGLAFFMIGEVIRPSVAASGRLGETDRRASPESAATEMILAYLSC